MSGKTEAGRRIAIQARPTEAEHALMMADMHRARYGPASEYLTDLVTSNVPMRITTLERIVGTIGIRTDDLVAHLVKDGVPQADFAEIVKKLTRIQRALAREVSGK